MAHTDRLLRLLNSVSYRGATAIAARHPARQRMTISRSVDLLLL
jgi:hypothetical protein